MVQRPIVMSAIAPVAVAAILILGILAGISSTAAAQLSKIVKKPYVSKPVRPYVSKPVKMTFTARLAGNNEVPPVNTPATGIARFELSSDGKVLNYHISTTNLIKRFQDNEPRPVAICEKEPVINVTTNKKTGETCETVARLSIGKGKITWQDLMGSFEDTPVSVLVKDMRSGKTYVNIYTQEHPWPNGEIIGQIRSG